MTQLLDQSEPPIALRLRGIRKSFGGVEVLHGIDLDIPEGRVVALLGENGAGKSTLVKIVSGDYLSDSGTVQIGSETFEHLSPSAAQELGVSMIYQELNDAPPLSVAENISLGNLPSRIGFVDWPEVRRRAEQVLADLEVDLDVDAQVSTLRVGQRQIIEIARALTKNARVLVLDEPTAALSDEESQRLFSFVKRLREMGTAMIYITHRLDELDKVADDVVVLRDGDVRYQGTVANSTRADLVEAMVGSRLAEAGRPEPPANLGQPVVTFSNATVEGAFDDISLQVQSGEIVALYGKVGSGIAEVCEAAYGLLPLDGGSIELPGGSSPSSPDKSVRDRVGYLPADRKSEGLFAPLSSSRNLGAASWKRDSLGGLWANEQREANAFQKWLRELRIKMSPEGAGQPILMLSGGNQQKVLLGRWLHADVQLLLLVEPTRGVDVGARMDIYEALRDLAATGIGILVATSDYEEVVNLADRALVMAKGKAVAELVGDEATANALTDAAGG